MQSKNDIRAMIAQKKMPNGKTFEKCSRIELYDIIMEAMQFIDKQHKEALKREQSTLSYKIKRFFNIKPQNAK